MSIGLKIYCKSDCSMTPPFQLSGKKPGAIIPEVCVFLPVRISTHTPLAGCDGTTKGGMKIHSQFQLTHPSRGATTVGVGSLFITSFQLTHPSRGATNKKRKLSRDAAFQLTPLAGCDYFAFSRRFHFSISTHTPLAGCDRRRLRLHQRQPQFQLTHPSRGATTANDNK